MTMRGKGFFMVGSAGLALGGLLHLSSQLGHGDIPLTRAAVEAAMRAYKIEMMGMTFSLKDVMDAWGISFGVLAIFGGAQNLVTVSLLPRSAGLVVLSATSARALQSLTHAETARRRAGARCEDVVRTRIYVVNIDDGEAVGRAHRYYFGAVRPATSMIAVSRLIVPEMLVGIEAEAIVPEA